MRFIRRDEVAIVVTDVTRAIPDDVLVDALFAELEAAGADRSQVTIVIGLASTGRFM